MKILRCAKEDVQNHYEAIRKIVSDVDEEDFKRRMLDSISNGTAFYVEDSSCFLYYLDVSPVTVDGVAFNGHHNPRVTLAFLASLFGESRVQYVSFYPHANAVKRHYKSLAAGKKIKNKVRVDVKRFIEIERELSGLRMKNV